MSFIKYMFPLVAAMGLITASAHAADEQDSNHEKELNERDLQALRDFLRTKRTEDLEQKAKNLRISGDVRSEWRHITERLNGDNLRGRDRAAKNCRCLPISRNDFDIEANLYVNYAVERAWALMQLQFDNSAGVDDNDCCCDEEGPCPVDPCGDRERTGRSFKNVHRFHGSGQCDDLCLKRAFMGYNIWQACNSRLSIELGRRKLYDLFESEIQYSSRFDGVALRYSSSAEFMADWYVTLAGFVVDERVNHLAWATEFGFLNMFDTGVDFKYSFIDWAKRGRSRCGDRNPRGFRYRNSQFLFSYNMDPEVLCRPVEFFGAFVINHNGDQVVTRSELIGGENPRDHHRRNLAWYLGVLIGEVEEEGDWSLEVQYQWVQAHAISWDDQNGIGLGNVRGECCGEVLGLGYKGWLVDFLYAVTDEITVDMTVQAAKGNEPGQDRHNYFEYKLEAIYAF